MARARVAFALGLALAIGTPVSAFAQEVQLPEPAPRHFTERAASNSAAEIERLIDEAESLVKAGDDAAAVEKYTQALALRPSPSAEPALLTYRASALSRLAKFDEALRDNNRAVALSANMPDDVFVRWGRAETLRMAGRHREALADYDAVLKLVPTNPRYLYGRGASLWRLGDIAGAKAAFDRAVTVEPRNVYTRGNRGYFRLELKDYAGAIADYSSVIEIDPNNVSAYVNRGNAYVQTNDFDKALSDYNTAQRLNAKHVSTYRGRGWLHQLRGNFDLARADYEYGLKLAPGDPWIRNALDRLPEQQH